LSNWEGGNQKTKGLLAFNLGSNHFAKEHLRFAKERNGLKKALFHFAKGPN